MTGAGEVAAASQRMRAGLRLANRNGPEGSDVGFRPLETPRLLMKVVDIVYNLEPEGETGGIEVAEVHRLSRKQVRKKVKPFIEYNTLMWRT